MARDAKVARDIKPLMEYRNMAWKCWKCGFCRMSHPDMVFSHKYSDNCPRGTRFRFESFYGAGTQELVRALTCDPPELDLTDGETAERIRKIVYTCPQCGACQVNCNPTKFLEPANASIALRQWLVEQGLGPLPEHNPLVKSILNYDNPWMQPRAAREKWAKKRKVKDAATEPVEILYYPGCTASYDPLIQPVAGWVTEVLQAAGVDFGILGKNEICCGSTILRVGDVDSFRKVRARNLESLNGTSAKVIVTACAGCFSTLTHEYAQSLNAKVKHIVELVDELIRDGRITFTKSLDLTVTYHDPCHVGRYCEIFDPPRNILEALPGVTLKEMERIREWSWCCGAGGGCRTAFPEEIAAFAAEKRLEEAFDTGARTLVTACPFCEQNLGENARRTYDRYGIEVKDVLELVHRAL
ncbi:MAG: (Fe-S)-binding protein [bacterium]